MLLLAPFQLSMSEIAAIPRSLRFVNQATCMIKKIKKIKNLSQLNITSTTVFSEQQCKKMSLCNGGAPLISSCFMVQLGAALR